MWHFGRNQGGDRVKLSQDGSVQVTFDVGKYNPELSMPDLSVDYSLNEPDERDRHSQVNEVFRLEYQQLFMMDDVVR